MCHCICVYAINAIKCFADRLRPSTLCELMGNVQSKRVKKEEKFDRSQFVSFGVYLVHHRLPLQKWDRDRMNRSLETNRKSSAVCLQCLAKCHNSARTVLQRRTVTCQNYHFYFEINADAICSIFFERIETSKFTALEERTVKFTFKSRKPLQFASDQVKPHHGSFILTKCSRRPAKFTVRITDTAIISQFDIYVTSVHSRCRRIFQVIPRRTYCLLPTFGNK